MAGLWAERLGLTGIRIAFFSSCLQSSRQVEKEKVMKKLVGTILAVATLVALIPANAGASSRPMPPSGKSGVGVTANKGGVGVNAGGGSHRSLPPVGRRLPPLGR